jgi:uncharacterized membrane protein
MNNSPAPPVAPIDLSTATEVEAPAALVWAILADYARDPYWRRGVVSMVPAPAGEARAGTTTAETLRLAGRTWRTAGLVTALEPGRRLEWRTTAGAVASGARLVEPAGEGRSRVTLVLRVHPAGAERLAAPLLRRVLARGLRRDAESLRRLAERSARLSRVTPRGQAKRLGCAMPSLP